MTPSDFAEAVERATDCIRKLSYVLEARDPYVHSDGKSLVLDATFGVNLPNEWRHNATSPTGVRLSEKVRFTFPASFPLDPPQLSLRSDFSRNFPHIQPWLDNGRPVPCVYDGELAELLHSEGIVGIANHMFVWLERAALGTLIDQEQGWEPVRRDGISGLVVAENDQLYKLVNRRGGCSVFDLEYVMYPDGDLEVSFSRVLARVPISKQSVRKRYTEAGTSPNSHIPWRKSFAIVAWPGKNANGTPIVCDKYLPESVTNLAELKERAKLYGCRSEVGDALNRLQHCMIGERVITPITIVIMLLVRRPYRVIGCTSSIELCPYEIGIRDAKKFAVDGIARVRPIAHSHSISQSLLAQMSGLDNSYQPRTWTMVGAGSLGSKISVHLGRTGNAPQVVVDNSFMSPHNAARHALFPPSGEGGIRFCGRKAQLLTNALEAFNQRVTPIFEDAAKLALQENTSNQTWSNETFAIVNTTASERVLEAFGASDTLPARIIDASLYSGGRAAVVLVEGPDRNPNISDLTAAFYSVLQEQSELASIIFDKDSSVSRQVTGVGCGSQTMSMTDARISMFAASISDQLLQLLQTGLPSNQGEIRVGLVDEVGYGISWKSFQIAPVSVLNLKKGNGWKARVHLKASQRICKATHKYGNVETGGLLLGRISELARVAHVVDVLDPPDDSTHSQNQFVLGTKGLKQSIEEYSRSVDDTLYCLGTWHSHLTDSPPSRTDMETAMEIANSRSSPSVFLIQSPSKIQAFMAKKGTNNGKSQSYD